MSKGIIALTQAFDRLNQAQKSLSTQLQQNNCRYWLLSDDQQNSSIVAAIGTITNIWHSAGGDGRRTENLYGLIGVPPHIIPLIHQLNTHKQNFQTSVRQFREAHGDPNPIIYKRAEELNLALKQQGMARVNLKQCYRQIPLLEKRPNKVTFSWYSSGRSLKKVTIKEAEQRLLAMDTNQLHIQLQLQALGKIPSNELLVQLQKQVPVMRANIVWKDKDKLIRKARNCPLPLFFPLDAEEAFPEYNTPSFTPPDQRKRQLRSDVIIDPEPYLPSLRIHRYKKT
ncbi:hypothetical protein ACMXYV_09705 [Neptuniibacter sp. SY11_33]|uniref:hypothetical protein n=1 Tax=Neptuniibacter sp. SY11_33 TaxID=3398215 RepID=UPI0039F635F0